MLSATLSRKGTIIPLDIIMVFIIQKQLRQIFTWSTIVNDTMYIIDE